MPPSLPILERFIRAHHSAFVLWLRSCLVDYGEVPQGSGHRHVNVPIIAVRAGVERAFGTIADLLIRTGWVPGNSQAERTQNAKNFDLIPTPFCTYNFTDDPTPDPERAFGVPKRMRKVWFNAETGEYESHRAPSPWRCSLVVNLFARKRYTEQYFREWLYSQMGDVGKRTSEMLIPVRHAEPWGTLDHSLRLTGSSDASELEGDNPRFIRTDFTFDLDMWLMHAPVATAPPVAAKAFHIAVPDVNYGVNHAEHTVLTSATFSQSENLANFRAKRADNPDAWNKTAATTVERVDVRPEKPAVKDPPDRPTLKIDYAGGDEFVTVADGLTAVDTGGLGVASVQFRYRSTRPVYLIVAQASGVAGEDPTLLHRVTLPIATAWQRVSRFVVIDKPVFFVALETIEGSLPCTTYVTDLDVRNLYAAPRIPPTEKRTVGADWQFVWRALDTANHLLVFAATHDADVVLGAYADADDAQPVRTWGLDGATDLWRAAIPVRPSDTTLGLTVPKSVADPVIYALPYRGAYEGHTI